MRRSRGMGVIKGQVTPKKKRPPKKPLKPALRKPFRNEKELIPRKEFK